MPRIYKLEMTREEWLEARKQGIGGSDAAAAFGISSYTSPYKLWTQKTSPDVPTEKQSAKMRFGVIMEEVIAREYCFQSGQEYTKCNFILIDAQYPFLIVNLDGYIRDKKGERGVIEVKAISKFVYRSWMGKPPQEYFCQMQHALRVTKCNYGVFVFLTVEDREFYPLRVERDDKFIAELVAAEVTFWKKYVVKNKPPRMSAEDLGHIKTKKKSTIEVDNDTAEVFTSLVELKEKLGPAIKLAEIYKNQVIEFMGKNEELTALGQLVATYRSQSDERFQMEKFKKKFPKIHKKFLKKTPVRKFRIKKDTLEEPE